VDEGREFVINAIKRKETRSDEVEWMREVKREENQ
jgi:hypothetical protein